MLRIIYFLLSASSKTLFYRFSALWIALLIAVILPPSREMLRFHVIGSKVAPQLQSMGLPWNYYIDDLDPAPFLKKEPDNAALAYWNLRAQFDARNDYYDYRYSSGYKGGSKGLFDLSKKFPDKLWLKSLALQAYVAEVPTPNEIPPPPGYVGNPRKKAVEIPIDKYEFVQDSAKAEPDNAFWPVCEAYLRLCQLDYKTANTLLSRAAKCRVYDDKLLEAARELVQVQLPFRPLSWEEKKVIYENDRAIYVGDSEANPFINYINGEMHTFSNRALVGHDYAGKLAMSVNLMRIGGLMQKGTNSLANCKLGVSLQNLAWRLGNPKTKSYDLLPKGNSLFAENVRQNGYPVLANEALQLKKESDIIKSWAAKHRSDSWSFSPVYLNQGGLVDLANLVRDSGPILIGYFLYLIAWWSFLNVFLFRGQGIASTRRERIVPVIVFGVLFIVLAIGIMWWNLLDWSASSPRSIPREELVVTIGVFAFVGLPFVLALFCGLAAMRRYKAQFGLPPRVDMELQLSWFQREMLRWLLPFAVVSSIAVLVAGWLFLALAIILDWGFINVLAWLPPDRNGMTGNLSFHPVHSPLLLIYGLIMCGVCISVWFIKWRFFTPKELKVFTHTGLRRWKETLGIAIITTIGIYIVGAVYMWPTRMELNRRMDKVLEKGPLSMAPQLNSQVIKN
jgi:hypothetical protein